MESPAKPLSLLVCIVGRGRGEELTNLLESEDFSFHLISLGKGTANSELLDMLGIGETDKDIVMSTLISDDNERALGIVRDVFGLGTEEKGIAFTIPMRCVAGLLNYKYFSGEMGEEFK